MRHMALPLVRICHQGGEMITQRLGYAKNFTKAWHNSVYFRLSKILFESGAGQMT